MRPATTSAALPAPLLWLAEPARAAGPAIGGRAGPAASGAAWPAIGGRAALGVSAAAACLAARRCRGGG